MSKLICSVCGSTEGTKTITKGSMLMEFVLWCCFLIPGLIYSFWRMGSRHPGCRKCGSPNMIPSDSPVAKKMLGVSNG